MTSETDETSDPLGVPFVWHSGPHHCGTNVKVPGDGKCAIEIRTAPPRFTRHDRINGRRCADTAEVTFPSIEVKAEHE